MRVWYSLIVFRLEIPVRSYLRYNVCLGQFVVSNEELPDVIPSEILGRSISLLLSDYHLCVFKHLVTEILDIPLFGPDILVFMQLKLTFPLNLRNYKPLAIKLSFCFFIYLVYGHEEISLICRLTTCKYSP
jgi:hypothetical protein